MVQMKAEGLLAACILHLVPSWEVDGRVIMHLLLDKKVIIILSLSPK